MEAYSQGQGENAMADQDLCQAIGEDLTRAYPGYIWAVGCDHNAGTVCIDLAVTKPLGLENWAYMLFISTVIGPGGQKRVMRAGGELLERYGLRRTFAHVDTSEIAREHGLDRDNNKNKSKH
jgi:hypothetical protein